MQVLPTLFGFTFSPLLFTSEGLATLEANSTVGIRMGLYGTDTATSTNAICKFLRHEIKDKNNIYI